VATAVVVAHYFVAVAYSFLVATAVAVARFLVAMAAAVPRFLVAMVVAVSRFLVVAALILVVHQ